jgi:hypothetical protein
MICLIFFLSPPCIKFKILSITSHWSLVEILLLFISNQTYKDIFNPQPYVKSKEIISFNMHFLSSEIEQFNTSKILEKSII